MTLDARINVLWILNTLSLEVARRGLSLSPPNLLLCIVNGDGVR